jgi:hypothetical protein
MRRADEYKEIVYHIVALEFEVALLFLAGWLNLG